MFLLEEPALAFGRIVRRDGRVPPLDAGAKELAKLLSCVPASTESRTGSFETCGRCKYLHFIYWNPEDYSKTKLKKK